MIIALVSRYERAGKSEAARHIIMNNMTTFRRFSFAFRLNTCAAMFLNMADKYAVHPDLGVSMKDINQDISETLTKRHPELPVYRTKQEIDRALSEGFSVVIDDMRRERELKWCQEVALKHGKRFQIIEVLPEGDALGRARLDLWSNGIEPCGYEAWRDTPRSVCVNNGTDDFYGAVLEEISDLHEVEDA